MSSIASKNLYELLGNDPELDPERATPVPPTKAIDKPAARSGKRNAPTEAPARSAGASTRESAPKDSGNANDNYLRDRGVGADKNRSRGARFDDSGEAGYSRGRGGRGRGEGRGGRGFGRGGRGAMQGDRHSRSGLGEHEKQAAHGWGGNDGNAELADETAGEAIAQKDEKEAVAEDAAAPADPEPEPEAEPEDKTKSYTAYLAELAEKKLSLGEQNVRKPNEGNSKKFPEGTAITREEEEAAYIAGSGGKTKRARERKEKNFVELDGDRLLQPAPRDNFGGRGRGGRGRGEGRGEFRGRGRGRGEGRGDRGDRGEGRGRGGRGGASGVNLNDSNAFPSLGA